MVGDRDGVRKRSCGAALPAICRQTTHSQVVFIVSAKTKAAASWDSPLQRAPTAHLGLGSEQPALVERVAAHCRGRWTGRDLKSPSNPNHSPVLQLSVPSSLKARERLLARVDTRPWPVLPSKLLVLSAHRALGNRIPESCCFWVTTAKSPPSPHTLFWAPLQHRPSAVAQSEPFGRTVSPPLGEVFRSVVYLSEVGSWQLRGYFSSMTLLFFSRSSPCCSV